MRNPATAEGVLKVVRLAVEARGRDYIYEPPPVWRPEVGDYVRWPRYFDADGRPEDIVGHVLAYHGFGPADVVEYAGISDRAFPYQRWFAGFDVLARALLIEIQRQQDLGSTYGYILERAEYTYGEMVRCALRASVDQKERPGVDSRTARHP